MKLLDRKYIIVNKRMSVTNFSFFYEVTFMRPTSAHRVTPTGGYHCVTYSRYRTHLSWYDDDDDFGDGGGDDYDENI
jgi:hypothetical protein